MAKSVDSIPIIANDMPVMYEDDGQDEMGESVAHTATEHALYMAIPYHLRSRREYHVLSNLDTFYHPVDRRAYVSPDLMVVRPFRPLREPVNDYRIGTDGPAPVLVIEILSARSHQQQDLTNKPIIYSRLGVREYILLDTTGDFLERRLLLRRLQRKSRWIDIWDADGGVTSKLGFRVVLEEDGAFRALDKKTGRRYLWLREAASAIPAATQGRRIEDRIKELEAELARLRRKPRA
jgi:hypothetical protein